MSSTHERRHFHRIHFEADAELRQGELCWPAHLHDLSLKGLLVETPANWESADSKAPFEFVLTLAADVEVRMQLVLAHAHRNALGFECQSIDLDSITHLRRLIDLNLGNHALLERDLAQLIHLHPSDE